MHPSQASMGGNTRIALLHHSTGENVWNGGVAEWFTQYNRKNSTSHRIMEQVFPKDKPYGWANYPYDYWNIWVKNAGEKPFMEEPTLELLSRQYDVIAFKHCFPVSSVVADEGKADVTSPKKTIANYELQYEALKKKLHSFGNTRFVVWTGALLAESDTTPQDAQRAAEFSRWVREKWDEQGDNIYLWDFAALEGEGGLYIKKEYQAGPTDSHPNVDFCKKAAPLFAKRLVAVIAGRGDAGKRTGED